MSPNPAHSCAASCATTRKLELPNLAQNLAANLVLARRAPAHHTSGGGQDADAQSAHYRADFGRVAVGARPGARNAPQAADHATAVRRVLPENAQHFARLCF